MPRGLLPDDFGLSHVDRVAPYSTFSPMKGSPTVFESCTLSGVVTRLLTSLMALLTPTWIFPSEVELYAFLLSAYQDPTSSPSLLDNDGALMMVVSTLVPSEILIPLNFR